jgi:hypothetical protein
MAVGEEVATVVKEAPIATLDPKATTKKTTATTEVSGAGSGGPGVVQADSTPDLKAAGKRPAATTGSGGSSPLASAFAVPRGMLYNFCRFFLFSPHSLCGFVECCFCSPGRQTRMRHHCPRIPEPVALPGWWPLGFSSRCIPLWWCPSSRV